MLISYFHVRSDGVTSHYAATGENPKFKLCQIFEKVHYKFTGKASSRGKSYPRWGKAIWAGAVEIPSSHVILTESGAHVVRNVKGLTAENQWDPELMESVWTPMGKT